MRTLVLTVSVFICSVTAFSQAGTGTINGTITDPAQATVANATVQVRNVETGIVYQTASTVTGNYTIGQLPPGQYEVTVTSAGFKKFTRGGLTVQAAQVLPVDIALEVGATTESVTVIAEATLLKTETGDLAHNINVESLDNLPILGIGGTNAGSSGIRNPFGLANLIPGVDYVANNTMVINGAPNNTAGYRIEGQDMTNHFVSFALQEMQPSADAIQEVAVQTSNFAAEYGVAGGGLFNITMKSGTNGFHGSGYDYFVNEDLNAAYPYTSSGNGNKVRPRNRRNDYGGTLGGPVWIPKIYDGRNKTFFFFNWEEFLESSGLNFPLTLPSAAYRRGDFSSISPNGGTGFNPALGVPTGPLPSVDGLGRPIFANTIYDPATERPGNGGVLVRDPFPGNMIPGFRIDPIAAKIQNLFPNPTTASTTNNAVGAALSQRTTTIPALKVDESLSASKRISFYWSKTYTDSQYSTPNGNADGLPPELTQARGTFFHYWITRLNYDHTVTPTLLLHLGAGYSQIYAPDDAPYLSFNAQQQLGLSGFQINRNFPNISGMCVAPPFGQSGGCGGNLGGMQTIGTAGGIQGHPHPQNKPSANANLTWVRGSHTYKLGAEVYWQGSIQNPFPAVLLVTNSTTNSGATALPFNPPNGLAGQSIGFGYANFLLGDFTSITQNTGADYRIGKSQWATFVQDSWKVTRKLTIDYGLRWDYGTYGREQYGRSANLGVDIPDPSAGGHLGGTIFEATCHCTFANNYPYAIGPRLGVAYQITPKTVLRAGWGVVYAFTPDVNGSAALGASNAPSAPGQFVNIETPGAIPQPHWPVFDPGLYPSTPGSTNQAPQALDRNAGRPPRQNQWSIGVQRELSRNLVVEAAYLGNRGVWWSSGIGSGVNLGLLEQISPATFAAYGLDPYHNAADNTLLSAAINSAAVVSKLGRIPLPYAGYPLTGSLLNALRPFPQYSTAGIFGLGALALSDVPTGKTWYDALQAKVTKRYSSGLQASGTFTWSKALINTREDFFNPQSSTKTYQTTDQPFLLNANILYTIPRLFNSRRALSLAVRDWQFGAFLQYGSGLPLTPPSATTTNNLASANGSTNYMIRNPGVSLYLKDLNCHCINPYTDQLLNPAAWTNPAAGTWGGNALFGDFRSARRPQENFNIGRNFRIRERMNLQIRAEFVNIFNRVYLGNPSTTNPFAPLSRNMQGQLVSGFGVINETLPPGGQATIPSNGGGGQLYLLPRTGTLIARFSF